MLWACCLAVLTSANAASDGADGGLGGMLPSVLVTFHGGVGKKDINNVYRYSLEGKFVTELISNEVAQELHGLRGLLYVPSMDTLMVSNAFNQDSKIEAMKMSDFNSACSVPSRTFNKDKNFLSHPYGLSLHPDGNSISVTNQLQDGDPNSLVTQFEVPSGSDLPKPIFASLDNFGDPRGLTWAEVKGERFLFVCEKTSNSVLKFNASGVSPVPEFATHVNNPIGITTTTVNGDLWLMVSSNGDDVVYAIDAHTGVTVKTYDHEELDHPCGLQVYDGTLYVLAQASGKLLSFDVDTGVFQKVLIKKFSDEPEDLLIVPMPECVPPTPAPPTHTPSMKPTPGPDAESSLPPIWILAAGGLILGGIVIGVGYAYTQGLLSDRPDQPLLNVNEDNDSAGCYAPPLAEATPPPPC